MAQVIKLMYNSYLDIVREYTDPVSDELLLMGSPLKIISITILYYLFIKKVGPSFMKYRQPYNVKNIMLAYNLFQVIANGYLVVTAVKLISTLPTYRDWSCHESSKPRLTPIERSAFHAYCLLKVSDYMDTVFMVLRKNYRQITFLHVYHHILMVFSTYAGFRFMPHGHVVMMGTLNSAVHVVMYAYYFLAALRPGIRNSLTWKKHITHIQLAQFFFLVIHFTRGMLNEKCKDGRPVIVFSLIQSIIMIILFSNFYINTYIKKPKAKNI